MVPSDLRVLIGERDKLKEAASIEHERFLSTLEDVQAADREIWKLQELVRAAYAEGFTDGMGDMCESECWENSQTRMCLKDDFEISGDELSLIDSKGD
jgi:hypothetical protein